MPVTFTVKNEKLAPPVVVLTEPLNNAKLSGKVPLTGYAYGPGGATVRSATILVDRLSYAATPVNKPRPEACAGLATTPAACPNIGFEFVLDTTKFLNGPHALAIRAQDSNGSVTIAPAQNIGGINIFIEN